MKRTVLTTFTLAVATPFALRGGEIPENPNRLSLGARAGYNFKADFRTSATASPAPVAGRYDDGYVLADSSGNAGGLTWNWGYENASQVVGDTIQFHAIDSSSAANPTINNVTDDPQYGVELIYQRILGSIGSDSSVNWGLEAGFSYTDLDLRANRSTTGLVTMMTDSFPLNGVIPPGPGYSGTFEGPGPLLGATPTPTTTTDLATLSSKHKLSGQMFGLRLGPFAELNLTSKFSLAGSVGLALAPTCLDYDFTESASLAGGGTSMADGHKSKTKLLYGYYVGAMLRYDFNSRWGIYGGAQFQSLNDMKISAGDRSATLDPGTTVFATAGLTWRF